MAELSLAKSAQLRPRVEPIQARAQRSRQKILDAAHALLKARGVHQLTTVAIAEASGVSVGALYRFFPNKESIVCQLYEEKLVRIRALGVANRRGDPSTTTWRAFFGGYFAALKAAERQVDFDFSLADAIFMMPQLWEIDTRHGVLLADQFAADLRLFGSTWSDEALFDLAVNLYALDASTWACWRYSNRYPALAIERLTDVSLGMMRPALEGEPEPRNLTITREGMLKSAGL
ncbi:MAG TPA: TetR/AcrR family transcriptional regulator [Caulobacteraceae bacterium]|jgi:AcrR family transcriptional regulator